MSEMMTRLGALRADLDATRAPGNRALDVLLARPEVDRANAANTRGKVLACIRAQDSVMEEA